MGFFSSIFGSSSNWDGSQYVEKVTGNKFWHKAFINKDEMRRYGQEIAFEADPMGPRKRAQGPDTIVGELIYLMMVAESQDDETALKAIARTMKYLLDNEERRLPVDAQLRFMMVGYHNYV